MEGRLFQRTENHKITPNNEDLKRKPLLCKMGLLSEHQPQQALLLSLQSVLMGHFVSLCSKTPTFQSYQPIKRYSQ